MPAIIAGIPIRMTPALKHLPTRLAECLVIEPEVYVDDRGYFYEAWNAQRASGPGLPTAFVQHNVSRSRYGVLRGLHYQWPQHPQGKLISVLEGEVYDVAVDIRRGSPSFGQHVAAILSADNRRQFWVPPGFAHGFLVLSQTALVTYLCTAPYHRGSDQALRWDDPALAIDWPLAEVTLSPKDAAAPLLADVPPERLPVYAP